MNFHLNTRSAAVSKVFRKHQDKIESPKSWAYAKVFYYRMTYDETLEFDSDCQLMEYLP